jgi:hypothetical protein
VIRVAALVLLMGCAAQGAADTVWCPDGCREGPVSQTTSPHQPSASGVCLFCGTGFVVAARVAADKPVLADAQAVFAYADAVSSPESHSIDHPPRTA